jgi:hypothetical protein
MTQTDPLVRTGPSSCLTLTLTTKSLDFVSMSSLPAPAILHTWLAIPIKLCSYMALLLVEGEKSVARCKTLGASLP